MNPLALLSPLSELIGIGRDWLEGKRKLKQVELEGKVELAKATNTARVQYAQTQQAADNNWDLKSIENSGWKDEWFTILLSIPMIMCFVPGGAQYVSAGFTALKESTPEWYQIAFLIAVGSAFGIKKIVELTNHLRGK